MKSKKILLPAYPVEQAILFIRGRRVMLDSDLAKIYRVPTKVLNQAVKRHRNRFPKDFMFRLTAEEKKKVVTICDHLRYLKFSSSPPHAFTEHGAVMLASLLNSTVAVAASIQVVRAFVRLRGILKTHADLAQKLELLERKYDAQFKTVFDAIRELMKPPETPRRRIGFRP